MRRGRWPFAVLFSVALLVLVGALAWLQYRWLGEVSEAERARLQTSLHARASEFADDFDREITRAYLTFQIDEGLLKSGASAFAARYDQWQKDSRAPQLVRSVYLVQSDTPDDLQEFQPAQRAFVAVPWPADLAPVRQRLTAVGMVTTRGPGTRIAMLLDPIVSSVPALMLPVPHVEAGDSGGDHMMVTRDSGGHTVIVVFDRQFLETTFLPSLVARYFPEQGADTYKFAVVDTRNPSNAVFSRGVPAGANISPRKADATVPLFAFRFELLDQGVAGLPRTTIFRSGSLVTATHKADGVTEPKTDAVNQRYNIVVEQRSTSAGVRANGPSATVSALTSRFTSFVSPGLALSSSGVWQLMLQHPAGSLEAAVGQARQRNLTLSFGILALLCISVGLIVVNAQRSQRLAAQQIDFVATVSHELRTPLAVIRSAAQNLSAGVVHEPAQAKRYGDLIEGEGRRLTDMIEQVLDYAGLSGDRRPRMASAVDMGSVVHDLVDSCRELFDTDRIEVSLNVAPDLPLVLADEGAIRRALQNLVTNALKYGADGRWIAIEARQATTKGVAEVQVTVSDRGRGIDAVDLAHIFEPFYRGAPARDRQIHGNGLGLSLVKRIAEAHGGRVTVKSAAGQGASFTIALPATSGLAVSSDSEATALNPHAPASS